MRKSQCRNESPEVVIDNTGLRMPKTVTCHVLSADTLTALSNSLLQKDHVGRQGVGEDSHEGFYERKEPSPSYSDSQSSLVLAGLHACGDLSVTMLRAFLECKDIKAVISIGCCYNLLSEEEVASSDSQCGFPMSKGVKSTGLSLGKNSRDLACQSAERWKGMGKDAGLHNFELHAFRAAFQMVLFRYHPEILVTSPAIGRQGKALRRQQHQKMLKSTLQCKETASLPSSFFLDNYKKEGSWTAMKCTETETICNEGSAWDTDALLQGLSFNQSSKSEDTKPDKCSLFQKFSKSGLGRLGLNPLQDSDLVGFWRETEPYAMMTFQDGTRVDR
ncbi:unnamed protein product [Ilex paraguariensis]|uniref:Methyltransferase domain-containing protein n=1 Tax=Ilex paraguariensis TaxID=185542 RepID=A0ABC8SLK3_9AQUA